METPNLTATEISRSSRRMSRPKREWEKVLIRFDPGTGQRVHAVLEGDEDHASFVRAAVDEKIARRLRTPRKPLPSKPD
jgi:hypothetical protein